jgi:hypothetical protein
MFLPWLSLMVLLDFELKEVSTTYPSEELIGFPMMLQGKSGTFRTSLRLREPCEDTPDRWGERLVGISTVPIPSTSNCLGGEVKGEMSIVEAKGVYVLNQPRSFATLVHRR